MTAAASRAPNRAARRGLVALARARLSREALARMGAACAVAVAAVFALVAVVLRVADGPTASLAGLLAPAAGWAAWVGAAPVALAAAADRRRADRRDGIAALAASRGLSPRALEAARTLGAMEAVALAIGRPLVALAVLVAALGGLERVAAHLAACLAIAAFSAATGVAIGGLATACGRAFERRGPSALAAIGLVPLVVAALLGHASWSIPGALDALLTLSLRAAGVPVPS